MGDRAAKAGQAKAEEDRKDLGRRAAANPGSPIGRLMGKRRLRQAARVLASLLRIASTANPSLRRGAQVWGGVATASG